MISNYSIELSILSSFIYAREFHETECVEFYDECLKTPEYLFTGDRVELIKDLKELINRDIVITTYVLKCFIQQKKPNLEQCFLECISTTPMSLTTLKKTIKSFILIKSSETARRVIV